MASKRRPLTERFWEKVNKTESCWLWTGFKDANGYGYLFVEWPKRPALAHRLSWELQKGDVPDGMWVLHRCDNPPCVNPEHLFLGTRTDNIRDMNNKGRHFRKLTEDAARAIRAGEMSPLECSRKFGVHPRYAYLVRRRESWKGLP